MEWKTLKPKYIFINFIRHSKYKYLKLNFHMRYLRRSYGVKKAIRTYCFLLIWVLCLLHVRISSIYLFLVSRCLEITMMECRWHFKIKLHRLKTSKPIIAKAKLISFLQNPSIKQHCHLVSRNVAVINSLYWMTNVGIV